MCRLRLFVVFFIAFAFTLRAENWPHWRGPSASGVSSETGLPIRWSDSENIAWKVPRLFRRLRCEKVALRAVVPSAVCEKARSAFSRQPSALAISNQLLNPRGEHRLRLDT